MDLEMTFSSKHVLVNRSIPPIKSESPLMYSFNVTFYLAATKYKVSKVQIVFSTRKQDSLLTIYNLFHHKHAWLSKSVHWPFSANTKGIDATYSEKNV